MFSLKKGQVVLIISAVLLIIGLLNLELKPPQTSKVKSGNKENKDAADLELATEVSIIKKNLSSEAIREIELLEEEVKKAASSDKSEKLKKLANAYITFNGYIAAGLYYLEAVALNGKAEDYVLAGDAFTNAYHNTQDSIKIPLLVKKAIKSYEEALIKEPSNANAKTGLGSCYVDASEKPMEGIQLLLEVVKEDSMNVKANYNLGLFSMRSGQYDKAIGRFEVVVKNKPSAEVYVFLAEAYEKSGKKENAIKALQEAKKYMIDPAVIEQIDSYIKTLKN